MKPSLLQILVVDDDVELCELVSEYLEPDGYKVESIHDGHAGLVRALSGEHVLVVLDYMLPGLNGFELLKQIRIHSRVPIVMLTARGDATSRIVGLQIGADDYLAKPFDPLELVARINAVLRRTLPETNLPSQIIVVGDLEIDHGTRSVKRSNQSIDLTLVEFALLGKLINARGRIVSREDLVRDVLHRPLSPFDRSMDTHVANLRKKLGHQVNGVERIKTVRSIGYIYADTPTSDEVSSDA